MTYQLEQLYHRRRDIHEKYAGQRQGGISTPSDAPYIFLFTGDAGEQHGYSDGYEENGVFLYTGEGQRGDMDFVRGNKAIRDHVANGKSLLLFESSKKKGYYRFKGEYACADYDDSQRGPDTEGLNRQLIRFKLIPVSAMEDPAANENDQIPANEVTDIATLKTKAYAAVLPDRGNSSSAAKRTVFRRSQAIKTYVFARAAGKCECCKQPAPFNKINGEPYLEPHHIRKLSDEGIDSPAWVGAICPSCHREIHHGQNGKAINSTLDIYIKCLEQDHVD
jgi:5-methylcytosine-specific restriction protein A